MAKKSHLYEYHKEHGKLTEFSGFDMPLWYRGIIEEHDAVRHAAGLFDVSHMGRFSIAGEASTDFLDHLLPSDVKKVRTGRAFYSTICNANGGIIDDVVTDKVGDYEYMMIVNAGNREKDWNWLQNQAERFSVELEDKSNDTALIAFQGPLALPLLQKVTDVDLESIRRFGLAARVNVSGVKCLISRTGYTGEDGFEIAVLDTPLEEPKNAERIWNDLLIQGGSEGVLPCGLGARDLLRLEAGMCLYGNDVDDNTTPVEAELQSIISRQKEEQYMGREVLEAQLRDGTKKKRIAFSMQSGGIPRHGCEIKFAGSNVGLVTSGSFSPTIRMGIGMGYVPPELGDKGQTITIQIRSAEQLASIVETPFYDTAKFGYRRTNKPRLSG